MAFIMNSSRIGYKTQELKLGKRSLYPCFLPFLRKVTNSETQAKVLRTSVSLQPLVSFGTTTSLGIRMNRKEVRVEFTQFGSDFVRPIAFKNHTDFIVIHRNEQFNQARAPENERASERQSATQSGHVGKSLT